MLKLEAGKRYWRRDGGVSGWLVKTEIDHPAFRFSDGLSKWYEDGVFLWGREESEYDLVREYTESQPLEWKRGIPTEEECRECWIVDGRATGHPIVGDIYAPEYTAQNNWYRDSWYLPLRIKPVEPSKPKTKTITLQQFTHTSGDKRWMVVEDGEMAGCWTATGKTKTVEVPCE